MEPFSQTVPRWEVAHQATPLNQWRTQTGPMDQTQKRYAGIRKLTEIFFESVEYSIASAHCPRSETSDDAKKPDDLV